MGWLRLVYILKLYVSFAEYHLFYRAPLQKRSVILRSLLIVATLYSLLLQRVLQCVMQCVLQCVLQLSIAVYVAVCVVVCVAMCCKMEATQHANG